MKKGPLEYQIVTKTYQKPTYLPTYATEVTVVIVVSVLTVVMKKLFSQKDNYDKNKKIYTNVKKLKNSKCD